MDKKRRKMILIGSAFVAIVIIFAIVYEVAKPKQAAVGEIEVAKVYDIGAESPYLTICFAEELKLDTILLDAAEAFTAKAISANDGCVDFILNNGDGIDDPGEYDVYLSGTTEKDVRIDRQKITINVTESLEVESEAANRQNEVALQNNDIDLNELRQADPIYEYLYNPFNAANYSIAEQIDDNNKVVLLIHINMTRPDSDDTNSVSAAENYKNEAFDQIRAWGFSLDNYNINVEYDS